MIGKSRLAYVCAFILPLLAALGAMADGPIPTPIPPVTPGQPIPPPGPQGCLCRCVGEPTTGPEFWFCGDPCIAIEMEVTVGSLTTWLENNCFPMLPGVDPADCVDCLAENLAYWTKWCKCQGEFDCDLNTDMVVDCEDLRLFLDFDRGECISRDQMLGLVCCFLEHVKLETGKGGCDTTFNGGCEAVKVVLPKKSGHEFYVE